VVPPSWVKEVTFNWILQPLPVGALVWQLGQLEIGIIVESPLTSAVRIIIPLNTPAIPRRMIKDPDKILNFRIVFSPYFGSIRLLIISDCGDDVG
jgi:hypothetical protein